MLQLGRKGRYATDMKRVVVAGEAVDQRLRGQRSVVHDPVGRVVLRGGHVLRWGGDAAGETLPCDLSGQVEACGLGGRVSFTRKGEEK